MVRVIEKYPAPIFIAVNNEGSRNMPRRSRACVLALDSAASWAFRGGLLASRRQLRHARASLSLAPLRLPPPQSPASPPAPTIRLSLSVRSLRAELPPPEERYPSAIQT